MAEPIEIREGVLLPGLAPAVMQTGLKAAENLIADTDGHPRVAFKHRDKGIMATIGKRKAAESNRISQLHFPDASPLNEQRVMLRITIRFAQICVE